MMISALYQAAREAIRAAGDDIGKARLLLTRKVHASQALREEGLEKVVEHALNYALRQDRLEAREGKASEPSRISSGRDADDQFSHEAQRSSVAASQPSSHGAGEEAKDPVKPKSAMPSSTPPSRAATAYRSVVRMHSGFLAHRFYSAPQRMLGDANLQEVGRELRERSVKHATLDAYLHALGAIRKVLTAGGGVVADHFTADQAQLLYENGRKAFSERMQRYLTAGA